MNWNVGPGHLSLARFEVTFVRLKKCFYVRNIGNLDSGKPLPWLPSSLSSTLFVREAHWSCRAWKTNVPQDPSDKLIYIIAQKHLRKKDRLSAPSSTCHCYEWLGFDVQWVKQTISSHTDVVMPKHVWTTKEALLIWLQCYILSMENILCWCSDLSLAMQPVDCTTNALHHDKCVHMLSSYVINMSDMTACVCGLSTLYSISAANNSFGS